MKWLKLGFIILYLLSCIAALIYCIINWNSLLLIYKILLIDYSLGILLIVGNIVLAVQNCQVNKEIQKLHSQMKIISKEAEDETDN